jgi:hypothetical protein
LNKNFLLFYSNYFMQQGKKQTGAWMMSDSPAAARQDVSPRLLWFARIMAWLCWAGIAATIGFSLLRAFGVFPDAGQPGGPGSLIATTTVSLGEHDPGSLPEDLLRDPFYITARFVPTLLTVWALLAARRAFANISKGEFFARSTSLGLRNLSLAVLLSMTLAPLITMAAHVAFALRMKAQGEHGELSITFGLSETTLLILIFAAAVTIIASVMAHAAKIAEENEQFV